MKADDQKLEGLDGLRGIAALVVLMHHALHRAGVEWFGQGYLAVDLFFMLSGFVIAMAYEDRLRDGMGVTVFAKIRLIRLYPLLALGVGLGAIEVALGVYSVPEWELMVLPQLLLVPGLWLAGPLFPLNGVQWSLFFELAVNVFHALIQDCLTPVALIVLVLGSAVALVAASWHYGSLGVGWSNDTFVGGFARVGFGYFAGVGLFRLHRARRLPRIRVRWGVPELVFLFVIVGAHALRWPQVTDVVTVLVAFPLVVVAAAQTRLRGLPLRTATWLGAISYPAYALQIAIAMPAKLVSLPDSKPVQVAYWLAINLLTVVLSWVALRYFDEPARQWLRRLTSAPRRPSSLQTVP